MLTSSMNYYKIAYINKLLLNNIHLYSKRKLRLLPYTCPCGSNINQRLIRVHSTHSDQHRQKAIIETTTPKIVIEKIDLDKVLPVEKTFRKKKELWKDRILPYVQLARWDKPIGVYLLYWPCSWSIALASISGTVPFAKSVEMAGLFLVGAGLMRGAGCTINDLWDRDIDAQVERTKSRPLVSGAISENQAVIFLAAQLSLALGVLLQLNCYSVVLGASSMLFNIFATLASGAISGNQAVIFLAAQLSLALGVLLQLNCYCMVLGASSMLLVVTYPLAKRFTNYPQLFLGATFNWGALLGYSAIQGTIDPGVCLPLYFGALSWTVLYDTIYAHQDKLDDARIGMKSTALTFGSASKPALCGVLCASVCCLAAAGAHAGLGGAHAAALAAYLLHAGRQIYTLDTENPEDCAKKFKSNSSVGLIILLGILGGGYSQYIANRQENMGKDNLAVTQSCLFS